MGSHGENLECSNLNSKALDATVLVLGIVAVADVNPRQGLDLQQIQDKGSSGYVYGQDPKVVLIVSRIVTPEDVLDFEAASQDMSVLDVTTKSLCPHADRTVLCHRMAIAS